MSVCNCCTQPPGSRLLERESASGSSGYVATGATAWADALADIPAFADTFTLVGESLGFYLSGRKTKNLVVADPYEYTFNASATRIQYRHVLHTATCYLKIWWDLAISSTPSSGGIISETTQSYEWTPAGAGGLCVPSGFRADLDTTWPRSVAVTVEPVEPPTPTGVWDEGIPGWDGDYDNLRYVSLRKFRYSLLPGYTPPDDGSANGFPT